MADVHVARLYARVVDVPKGVPAAFCDLELTALNLGTIETGDS